MYLMLGRSTWIIYTTDFRGTVEGRQGRHKFKAQAPCRFTKAQEALFTISEPTTSEGVSSALWNLRII